MVRLPSISIPAVHTCSHASLCVVSSDDASIERKRLRSASAACEVRCKTIDDKVISGTQHVTGRHEEEQRREIEERDAIKLGVNKKGNG